MIVQQLRRSASKAARSNVARRLFSSSNAFFEHLEPTPADPILGLTADFKRNTSPQKVNLSQGAYRDDDGNPYVLKCVREAEKRILSDSTLDKEYLPVEGLASFREVTRDFVLGDDHCGLDPEQVAVAQTLSGTGALRILGAFIKACGGDRVKPAIYMSSPTWGNHHNIFRESGLEIGTYHYLNEAGTHLDYEGMVKDLRAIPAGSVVLLHACAHNPTGVDPTPDQWDGLAKVCLEQGLLPFFDTAYQGYASGDLDADAYSVRTFIRHGLRPLIAQSYAKNLGLYGERVGAASIVCDSKESAEVALGHLKQKCVRPMYSSPPIHGARIAAEVMGNPELRQMWGEELKSMAHRVADMRGTLRAKLEEQGTPNQSGVVDWSHITDQIGMFAYTGLSADSVNKLLDNHDIYMTKDGRMNVAGLFSSNVAYVAESLHSVLSE